MSSPANSPNFHYFYQELLQEIHSLREATRSLQDEIIKSAAIKLLDEIRTDYSEFHRSHFSKPKALQSITQNSQEKIQQIAQHIFNANAHTSDSLKDDYNQKISHFEQVLNNFAYFYEHRLKIKEQGLEFFLGKEEWANQIFVDLFKKKHPWAMQRVESWMEEKSPLVFELMLDLTILHENPGILEFYIQNKDDSQLEDTLKRAILKNNKAVQWLICKTLHRVQCLWMKNIFVSEIRHRENHVYIQMLRDLFFVPTENTSWINELVIMSFAQQKQWAVEMVFEYLKEHDDIEFIKALIDLITHQEECLHTLTAFAILFKPDHSFSKVLLSTFSFLSHRVERGVNLVQKIVSFTQKNPDLNFFQWHLCSEFEHICILQLFMRREHSLVGVLTGSIDPAIFRDKPISKCFPKAGSVLIGDSQTALFLSEKLTSHGVNSYYPLQVADWPDLSSVAQPLIGEQGVMLWVQDLASVHENQIRLPNAVFLNDEHTARLVELRGNRLAAKFSSEFQESNAAIGMLGCVDIYLSQLGLLSYLLRKGISVQKMAIQFNYLEGGNYLIGEQNGQSYALIGKDSVEASRFYLQNELAQLGLRKGIDNHWSLEAPYPMEACILEDEDLKYFIMLDLGLESIDQVYFVEQPAYHLDVAMLLVEGKKILINNSRMSATIFMNYFTSEMEKGRFSPEQSSVIVERLSDFMEKSDAFVPFENAANLDLVAQGFEVIEVGGNYNDILESHPELHIANFFNALTITCPRGEKILIGLQGNEFIKKHFEDLIQTYFPDIAEYITLTKDLSEHLLSYGGGIHCKTLVFNHPHLI